MYKKLPRKLTNKDVVGKPNDPTNVYKVKVRPDNLYRLQVNPLAYASRQYTLDELREAGFRLVT